MLHNIRLFVLGFLYGLDRKYLIYSILLWFHYFLGVGRKRGRVGAPVRLLLMTVVNHKMLLGNDNGDVIYNGQS